ncbi:hypothetical protein PN498_11895 [Oscillatoria sp. CS-180]|uniref:hypothetical protein n=1 Tax=Oscillatoria sp. CS-180 TaxID=3021720 RepID=UPI00232BCB79|nr:hypothetical protein [Oscillatoria sp. CS-180]MDB9526695.1 hypothetical protein [Oscillatoria sp. CS-180]
MPKQNYGRNGLSNKPNANAENHLDLATNAVDAENLTPGNVAAHRAAAAPENEEATERPDEGQSQSSEH